MTAPTSYSVQNRIYQFGQFIERTVILVVVFGVLILASSYFFNIEVPNRDLLFVLSAVVAAYTLIYHQFVYARNPTVNVAFIDAMVYSTFIFLLNHYLGGLESPLFFLYLLPIISVRLNLGSQLPLAITIYIAFLNALELLLQTNPNPATPTAFLSSFNPQIIYLAATNIVSILLVGLYIRAMSIEFSTEHAQLEEINGLNQELKRIDRGKDEFISIASHEIRTPLTAIRGGLEALISGSVGKLGSEQSDFVEKILEASNRLSKVAEDSLNISSLEKHRLTLSVTDFDLVELVQKILALTTPEAQAKKIKLTFEKVSATLPLAVGDPERIQTVVTNLLDNAIKFTPSGGEVTVSVRSSGSKLITSVRDSGVGIPKEELHNLFRKFYRVENVLDEDSQGTGLGLYIVKLIMDLHGETIGVESELGKGSIFTFSLKAAHGR